MASETTAAATGAVGVVRRDPMAMLPFCGYNMGDYFQHWLDMGKKIPNPPAIFNVNWFRTNEQGKFIWPGFGDNFRILQWIIARAEGKVGAVESPIGFIPNAEDIDITNIEDGINLGTIKGLLSIDKGSWETEMKDSAEWLNKFERLPKEIRAQYDSLVKRLGL
jgi:phosphoenolpyruvate carboxykinase (GTP)